MKSFYRHIQRYKCHGKQAKTGKKEKFQFLRNRRQRTKCTNWEKIQKISQEQEKEEDRKRASESLKNADFWPQGQKVYL